MQNWNMQGGVLTKVIFDVHVMENLDELPDGADVASIGSAVQRSKLPLVSHIDLHRIMRRPSVACPGLQVSHELLPKP